MKRLAAGLLALAVVAGVTACEPSEEEKQRQHDCAQQYIYDHWRKLDTQEALDKLNKELEPACKVNPGFLRNKES
ncbi:hypothetical protein ARZXY2_1484 [Arthrobacter sp. ZXY-2]|nr:hypothetical protein ARZXY2_1484 [Arthrobacter sp. ZXY-2]